jgi:hypothetical protein
MNYTPDDVRGHIRAALVQMKLALQAEKQVKDGDLADYQDMLWDLASFELILHNDLDCYAAFNALVETRIEDHTVIAD